MTQCFMGGHEYPIEDEDGAYCERHGVMTIFKTYPLTGDGLTTAKSDRIGQQAGTGGSLRDRRD